MLRRSAMRCLQFSCGKLAGFSRVRTASPAHFRLSRACALFPPKRFRASRACALFPRHVFELCACAHGFPCAFSGFSRLRTASPTRFRASRACARLPRHVFELLACAHCSPGAFSGFARLRIAFPGAFSSFSRLRTASPACFRLSRACAFVARRSLAYEFLFARTARIFAALRQKAQKLAARFRASRVCARRSCASSQRDALFTVFLLANSRALRGGGREEHFQFGSDKNQHTVRSFLWQKLRN